MGSLRCASVLFAVALVAACSETATPSDAGTASDTGPVDTGPRDTGSDGSAPDVVTQDVVDHDGHAIDVPTDTGPVDTGPTDTGPTDTGPTDTGPVDTGPADTGPVDTGPADTGMTDTGPADAGCGDPMTSNDNCGGCGRVCCSGSRCSAGTCVPGCAAGLNVCPPATPPVGCFSAGVCVDTRSDVSNCGGCGRVCCAGNVCAAGMCVNACSPGNTSCPPSTPPVGCFGGGICRDLQTDNTACGACGAACPTGQVCVAGACQAPFTAVAPCNAPGDYAAGSTVRFGGSVGTAYEPRCLTVRVGDSVTFEGAFSSHPLSPSTRGTSGTPIARTSAGSTATFRFAAAGHFPYFCEFHGTNSGSGMAGVVRVVE